MSDSILLLEYEYDQLMVKLDEYLDLSEQPGGNTTAFENFRLDCLIGYAHNHDSWRVGMEKASEGIFSTIISFFASILKAIGSVFGFATGVGSSAKRYQKSCAAFDEAIKNHVQQDENASKSSSAKPEDVQVKVGGLPTHEQVSSWAAGFAPLTNGFIDMLNACNTVRVEYEKELKTALSDFRKMQKRPEFDADGAKEKYHTTQHQKFSPVVKYLESFGLSITANARLAFSSEKIKLLPEGATLDGYSTDGRAYSMTNREFLGYQPPLLKVETTSKDVLQMLSNQMSDTRNSLVNFANTTKSPGASDNTGLAKTDDFAVYRKKIMKGMRTYLYICSNLFIWIRTYLKSIKYVFDLSDRAMTRFRQTYSANRA